MSSWNANWSRWSVTISRVAVIRSSVLVGLRRRAPRDGPVWAVRNSDLDYRDYDSNRQRDAPAGPSPAGPTITSAARAASRSAAANASGWPVTAARNGARSIASRMVSLVVVTVAVRGTPRSRAISPKPSPGVAMSRRWWPSRSHPHRAAGEDVEAIAGFALADHRRSSAGTVSQACPASHGLELRCGQRAEQGASGAGARSRGSGPPTADPGAAGGAR